MKVENIVVELDNGAYMPYKAHCYDAGFDLYARKDQKITSNTLVDTGVHMNIPNGYVGLVFPRSSMSLKNFMTATGVIDSGYTGSIKVNLKRPRFLPKTIKAGERIAQIVIIPLPNFALTIGQMPKNTERGFGGFGSTGV